MENGFEEGEPPLHLDSHAVKRPPAAARDAEDQLESTAAKGQTDQVSSDSMSQVDPGWRYSPPSAATRLAFFRCTSTTLLDIIW